MNCFFLPKTERLSDSHCQNDQTDDDDDGSSNDGQNGHDVTQNGISRTKGNCQNVSTGKVELSDVRSERSGNALQLRKVRDDLWTRFTD